MRTQLNDLRRAMREQHIDLFIVSDKDEHLSEYTGAHFCALAEFSGFTGGDGTLIVTDDLAALWTDGRYFTQAEIELDGSGVELMRMGEPGTPQIRTWILEHLPEGGVLGFDGKCTSYMDGLSFINLAKLRKGSTVSLDLCGQVWIDKPEEECTDCFILDTAYTGCPANVKLTMLRNTMRNLSAVSHVIASLDDIAWLLNLRAHDIPCNPVFMAYLIVTADRIRLYSDEAHFDQEVQLYLKDNGVELLKYDQVFADTAELASPVLIDRKRSSYELCNSIAAGSRIIDRMNPTMTDKCCKNHTERENIHIAQHKDSIAVTRFLYWFQKKIREMAEAGELNASGESGKCVMSCESNSDESKATFESKECHNAGEMLTEWSCVEKLHNLRAEQPGFLEESFGTISAYAANAAMAHYSPSPDHDVRIGLKGLYLVDSGGQYMEGTTDITRTVCCGVLTDEERKAFTLAVIGNLRLADARFLEGTSGLVMDYPAREPFWRYGMNFNHGTGHGVGHVLNVHEGPVGIRYKASTLENAYPMLEGMYVSDEPGYYEGGRFGVRMENMLLVEKEYSNEYGNFMRFDTCTLVPMDRDCLDLSLMTEQDIALWNDYHAKVLEALAGDFSQWPDELAWLEQVCAPL